MNHCRIIADKVAADLVVLAVLAVLAVLVAAWVDHSCMHSGYTAAGRFATLHLPFLASLGFGQQEVHSCNLAAITTAACSVAWRLASSASLGSTGLAVVAVLVQS